MVKIPIGISNFKELHDEGCYFVDKSLFNVEREVCSIFWIYSASVR